MATETKMDINALQLKAYACQDAARKVESRRSERKDELWAEVRALESRLKEQLDQEFNAEQIAADRATFAAQRELDAALIETAAERTRWPLGTVLCEWKIHGKWYNHNPPEIVRTGVVQVFREGDPYPANRAGVPSPGTVGIRIRKKNGELGLDFESGYSFSSGDSWLPEGQKPKGAK